MAAMAATNSQRKRQLDDPENPNDPGEQDQIDAEDLINEVQLHDVIYNKQNKSHSRITSTEAAWVKIAEAVGSTPQQCQKRWANLRRCFRDAITKENLPSGSGAARGRKKFPFMAQMEFLREHMMKKANTVSNFDVDPKQPSVASADGSGPYRGDQENDVYTGNSLSTPFSGFAIDADIQDNDKKDDANGLNIDYEFLKRLSPPAPEIPLFDDKKTDNSDDSDGSASEGKQDQPQTSSSRGETRKDTSGDSCDSEQNRPKRQKTKVTRNRKDQHQIPDPDVLDEPEPAATEAQHSKVRAPKRGATKEEHSPGSEWNVLRKKRKNNAKAQPVPRNLENQEPRKTKKNKRSSSESVDTISLRKKAQRKRVRKDKANVSARSETDDETTMFRTITNAAASISNRNKQRDGSVDGIVKGFVKMQKHMLMKINEDSRYAYIKEATCKLAELCEREQHII